MREVEIAYLNGQRSKNVQAFVFAGLLTVGVVGSTAVPVLAGNAAFSKTGSMNTARVGHSATLLARHPSFPVPAKGWAPKAGDFSEHMLFRSSVREYGWKSVLTQI